MIRDFLIVFIGLFGISYAIVCPPNFCASVNCTGVTKEKCDSEKKDFRPRSTFCGCCDQCIDYLKDGDECGTNEALMSIMGGPPLVRKRCGHDLRCVHNICQQKQALKQKRCQS